MTTGRELALREIQEIERLLITLEVRQARLWEEVRRLDEGDHSVRVVREGHRSPA